MSVRARRVRQRAERASEVLVDRGGGGRGVAVGTRFLGGFDDQNEGSYPFPKSIVQRDVIPKAPPPWTQWSRFAPNESTAGGNASVTGLTQKRRLPSRRTIMETRRGIQLDVARFVSITPCAEKTYFGNRSTICAAHRESHDDVNSERHRNDTTTKAAELPR